MRCFRASLSRVRAWRGCILHARATRASRLEGEAKGDEAEDGKDPEEGGDVVDEHLDQDDLVDAQVAREGEDVKHAEADAADHHGEQRARQRQQAFIGRVRTHEAALRRALDVVVEDGLYSEQPQRQHDQ
eukprot:6208767-Pleurochrysis_carterae.AAC.4